VKEHESHQEITEKGMAPNQRLIGTSDRKPITILSTTDPAQARANKRLAEQIRKILGKHYASKYRMQ
jgi:hypothetical protein